ncbi:MAG: hypothetical protein WD032_05420 [Nitrospirales bacterium]
MTATIATMFSLKRPSRWTMLFAESPDKDLDFDEGFEEDELHQSKPPSRRPLLWLLLLVVVGAAAYWFINNQSLPLSRTPGMETMKESDSAPQAEDISTILPPLYSENQTVTIAGEPGELMLMGDPTNSQPGPMVQARERLTILDGLPQPHGWVYLVKTASGKTGWVSEEKLKK